MASNIPASLRSADIGRYALRAAQLERAKPVVAYWCNFWIVNQIIERGLHTSDDNVKSYTTDLVDKLEKFRSENTDNDAVMDAEAANAYLEQFGLEILGRAEATMKANKVTNKLQTPSRLPQPFSSCARFGPTLRNQRLLRRSSSPSTMQ
ncbi:hypothetical protein ASPCADRAFT_212259 [Aspergillus carbonarius ITEM 5010]|uniref:Vta1/callose synthase N-terminal domain-containing protein n=1 Tax=Aspergillus carbonarius (strain ITEM 5010) TaxID=602072 RepID=A0A1R3R6C0_ASPC5|nr:hypothetical protein ASPCADRAFT_212259 [Aspergillus carbonarius ITEM 5010]